MFQIGGDKFTNGHHNGQNENVDQSIVEEILFKPEWEHLGLITTLSPRGVWGFREVVMEESSDIQNKWMKYNQNKCIARGVFMDALTSGCCVTYNLDIESCCDLVDTVV